MGKIKIMLDNVRSTNQSISTTMPVLNQVKSGALSVKNSLYSPVLRRNGISGSFSSINSMLSDIITRTNNLTKAIDLYVRLYEQNERKLTDAQVKTLLSLLPSTGKEATNNANAFLDDLSPSEKTKIIDKIIGSFKIKTKDFIGRYGIVSIPLWAISGGGFGAGGGGSWGSTSNFIGASGGGGGGSWGPTSSNRDYKESTSLLQLHRVDDTWSLLGKDFTESKRERETAKYLLKYNNDKAGNTLYVGKITNKTEDSLKAGYEFKDFNDNLKDKLKKNNLLKETDPKSKIRDLATGEVIDGKDKDIVAEKKATLIEKEIKGTKSYSVLDYEKTSEGKYTNSSVNAKVLNAEIEGSLSGGLYAMDKDGKTYLSPGVSAKAKASVSAFEGELEGQIGSDMLGVYGKGDVKVLAAEATAGVGLGIVNGKLEATANLGAEAVLFEAEAEVGANILGGEVGVSGSVKFGVGATADFGYSDGKIKCELGASLGLGVEIGFEADIGGMVDTVTDVAGKAVNAVQKGAEATFDYISKGWSNLFG
ncbi:MAG TPA: hypothetical protein GXZ21_04855 [Clostridiales bacterium]|nr:hypothetical protein [Clostridiales bacterium]